MEKKFKCSLLSRFLCWVITKPVLESNRCQFFRKQICNSVIFIGFRFFVAINYRSFKCFNTHWIESNLSIEWSFACLIKFLTAWSNNCFWSLLSIFKWEVKIHATLLKYQTEYGWFKTFSSKIILFWMDRRMNIAIDSEFY